MPARRGGPSLDMLAAAVRAGRHIELTWEMAKHLYFQGLSDRDAKKDLAAWAKREGLSYDIAPRRTGPVMVDWIEFSKEQA
jgi:hypothetical protein